jgi:phage gp36-like protein
MAGTLFSPYGAPMAGAINMSVTELKAIDANDRFDGMAVTLADGSSWVFDKDSALADASGLFVLVPDAGTGRWIRKDEFVKITAAATFSNTNNSTLFTAPFDLVLHKAYWEVTTGWSGGSSSAIGVDSDATGYSTAGDVLGGSGGDVAAGLLTGFRGTVGAKMAGNVIIPATKLLRFNRITSVFTAGAATFHCLASLAKPNYSLPNSLSDMATKTDVTLLASATQVASGVGSSVDIGNDTTLRLYLAITDVVGGSPTLDVSVETSKDGSTNWRIVGAFPQQTTAGETYQAFTGLYRYNRIRWVLAGTSFDVSVIGESVQTYATEQDFWRMGVRSEAVSSITATTLDEYLESATDKIAGYLGSKYTLPLASWGDDVRRCASIIAAWDAMSVGIGIGPTTSDEVFEKRYLQEISWLKDIAKGIVTPSGIVDSTPTESEGGGYVFTRARRGW